MKKDIEIVKNAFTEDEWSELWIELYLANKEREDNKGKPYSAVSGNPVSITLTKKDHLNSGTLNK